MPELSLNLDPSGGLWPVRPAAAPTADDEPAIDFGALIAQQGLQAASSEQTGFRPAGSIGLKPNGSEERHVVSTERPAAPVAPETHHVAPSARRETPTQLFVAVVASSPQPGFPPAEPVFVSSAQPGVHPAEPVFVSSAQPGVHPAEPVFVSSAQPGFHPAEPVFVSSEQPGFHPAEPVFVSSEQPGFSPADAVGLKPDGSNEQSPMVDEPLVEHEADLLQPQALNAVVPDVQSPEQPGFSPAGSVGLKPDASNEQPGGSKEPRVVANERIAAPVAPPGPVVPLASVEPEAHHIARGSRRVIPVQPGVSPAMPVGLKPDASNEQPDGSHEPLAAPAVVMSVAPPAAQAPGLVLAPTPAPTLEPAPTPTAPAPLQVMVPTTEDGTPVATRLVEMMRWQAQEGGGQAELRLRPEFLGAVTVSIVVEHGAVKAIVSAETTAALEYLRAESSSLQEALEERGLTLDEFEVREESPLAEHRRRDDQDARPHREAEPTPPRRRVRADDGEAVFNVLM